MKSKEPNQPLPEVLALARTHARESTQRFESVFPLIRQALEKIDLSAIESAKEESEAIVQNLEEEIEELLECCLAESSAQEVEEIRPVLNLLGNLKLLSKHLFELMEEIKIKISEDILFSNRAFKQLLNLWTLTTDTFNRINSQIQTETGVNVDRLLAGYNQITVLIDQYEIEHEERLIRGVCPIKASSMFLNILDSIRNISRCFRAISMAF